MQLSNWISFQIHWQCTAYNSRWEGRTGSCYQRRVVYAQPQQWKGGMLDGAVLSDHTFAFSARVPIFFGTHTDSVAVWKADDIVRLPGWQPWEGMQSPGPGRAARDFPMSVDVAYQRNWILYLYLPQHPVPPQYKQPFPFALLLWGNLYCRCDLDAFKFLLLFVYPCCSSSSQATLKINTIKKMQFVSVAHCVLVSISLLLKSNYSISVYVHV